MRNKLNRLHLLLIIALITIFTQIHTASATNVIITAMDEEIDRSVKNLKIDMFGAPYFLSYQIKDISIINIGADFGSIYSDTSMRNRNLFIDLRVGSYEDDNSESGKRYRFKYVSLPLEDDVDSLKRTLWLATDDIYKNAITTYLRKKGQEIQKIDIEKLSDFSPGEKNISIKEISPTFELDRIAWKRITKKVSGHFKRYSHILKSKVNLSAKRIIRYYVNSEGTKILDSDTYIYIDVVAWSQAKDGMWLNEREPLFAKSVKEMPTEEKLIEIVDKLAASLKQLQQSEVITPYIGPALLGPDAAAVLMHEAIGHRLEGERQRNEKEGNTFKGKVGETIMPSFMNLYDNPSLNKYNDVSLYGHYKFDDEGQIGQNVALIEKGVLKNFLLSRKPIKDFTKGNGHGRSDGYRIPMSRMANLIVDSEKKIKPAELKKMLIQEAKKQNKEYGLLLKKVTAGETNTSRYNFQAFKGTPILIYKVYVKDGREELMRGAEFVGTPLSSINKIIATGDDYRVFNGYCGAESGYIPVTAISPSILLSEIELQRKPFKKAKLPILSPPAFTIE